MTGSFQRLPDGPGGRLKVKSGKIIVFSLRALGTVQSLLLVTELFGLRIARRIGGDTLAHHQPLRRPFRLRSTNRHLAPCAKPRNYPGPVEGSR